MWNFLDNLTEPASAKCHLGVAKFDLDERLNRRDRQGANAQVAQPGTSLSRSRLFLAPWRLGGFLPGGAANGQMMRIPNAIALGVNIEIRSPIGTNAQRVGYIKAINGMWVGSTLDAESHPDRAHQPRVSAPPHPLGLQAIGHVQRVPARHPEFLSSLEGPLDRPISAVARCDW
jgi:hypothetical protein